MPITYRTGDEAGFRDAVRSAVVGTGQGEVEVLDVRLSVVQNAVDEFAWQVMLVLPRPRGDTWEFDALEPVRERARDVADALAYRHDVEVEGHTQVWPTTDDLRPEDIPIDDEPDPYEGLQPDTDVGASRR